MSGAPPAPSQFVVAADISSVCFVYAFQDTGSHPFAARVEAVKRSTWTGEMDGAPVWRTKNYAEVDDLLPYVANYLTPTNEQGATGGPISNITPTAQFWTLNIREQGKEKPRWAVPWSGGLLKVMPRDPRRAERSFAFTLDEVQLALFGQGVGFLAFWVTPSDVTRLEDWLSFVYHFRTVKGRGGTLVEIEMWRMPTKRSQTRYRLFPPAIEPADATELNLMRLRDELLRTAVPCGQALDPSTRWWKDAYVHDQLLPYAMYFVDTDPPQQPNTPTTEMMTQIVKIRKFFAGDHEVLPSSEDLEPSHPSLLPYAKHMWFTFSLTGAAFVAFNAPAHSVFRNALARRSLPEAYFLLFLLALQQRFTLMMLSDAVAERWLPALHAEAPAGQAGRKWTRWMRRTGARAAAKREAFGDILEAFLAFTARGYFTQVIQGERHHNYYRKWQEIFQVPQLYEEVRDELNQMRDHLELIETRQLNEAVQFLTAISIILAIIGAISAWWAMNFEPMAERAWPLSWPQDFVLLNAVMAMALLAAVGFFWRKRWILQGRRAGRK